MLRIPKGDCRFECLRCKNTAKRQHGKIFSDLLTERREKPNRTIDVGNAGVNYLQDVVENCRQAFRERREVVGGGWHHQLRIVAVEAYQ